MAETSTPTRTVPRKATGCGRYPLKMRHAAVLEQEGAHGMPLGGSERTWEPAQQQRGPLRDQTASAQAEGREMQGHLFCLAVLRQHCNGGIWSPGQKPAA